MRVTVIGGTQFIGRAIVERLLARGHDVAVLHRRDTHDLDPAVQAPRLLGVAPTPFETAILASFAWYRAQPRGPIDYTFEDSLLAD